MVSDKVQPPAIAILREAGFEVDRLDYAYMEHGGTGDAARKLGINEHAIVKTLVFDDGNGKTPVLALMHGDRRVSIRKLRRLAGIRRLLPASPLNAWAATGFMPGGICPFGLKAPLPVFAQKTLFEYDKIYINAGERGVIAVIPPTALSFCGALACDIISENNCSKPLGA